MRDLLNNCTVDELVPAVNTGFEFDDTHSSATVLGTSVDLKGEGRKCLILISIGATATATVNIAITSGTDNSTFGTTEYTHNFDTTGLTEVDLAPQNRYMRVEYTVSETAEPVEHCYVSFSVKGVVYNERYIPSNVA